MQLADTLPRRQEKADSRGNPGPLGERSVRGAFWNIVSGAGTKLLGLASQIALAWFLVPDDLGLVAMAYAIAGVGSILMSSGIRDLLIQRTERFNQDASDAFWLSLALSTAAALVLSCLAPLAGMMFREPRVVPLLLILGLSWPLSAPSMIYFASLYRALRFKTIASIRFGDGLIQAGGAVLLAANGFGAYSLVLPGLARVVYLSLATRIAAGRIPIRRPHPRLWPAILLPALWLMLNAFLTATQYYGPGLVIGIVRDSAVTGLFFWGLQLSSQALVILSTNLKNVSFPTFTQLNVDRRRQYRAFTRICRVVTMVVAPICLLQMLTAGPLIESLFPNRWASAIPVVEWLSLGLITQPLYIVTAGLLMARGRFRTLCLTGGMLSSAMLAAALIGSFVGGPREIAVCTAGSCLVAHVLAGWIGFREFGRGWHGLFRTILMPFAIVSVSGAVGFCVSAVIGASSPFHQVLVTCMAVVTAHLVLCRYLMPEESIYLARQLKLQALARSSNAVDGSARITSAGLATESR